MRWSVRSRPARSSLRMAWEGRIPHRWARCGRHRRRSQERYRWYGQRRTGRARPGWRRTWRHDEGLEHDLGHLLPVGLGVEGSLSQEDGLLLGGNTELVVEGVVPDLLHVIPVGDDSVLHGVLQGEDTPLGLGLVTDIGVLLSHTDHDSLVAGTADDGGEDCSGSVISGEASLAHAGAIVNHQGSNVFVTHLELLYLYK